MAIAVTRTPILNAGDAEAKREEIRRYFHDTFNLDEHLYDLLADEMAFYQRAEPLRHPLIFYLGHTASFFINKLLAAQLINERVNAGYEAMFAVGVDEMSWDDLDPANYDWPTVAEVKAYRNRVREIVDATISALPLALPIDWASPFWVIVMGIEHERIHIETSSVIIRRLPIDKVRPLASWPICPETGAAPANALIAVDGGTVTLGKPRQHPLYGWDNEYGIQQNDVWAFEAARMLVSNGEFRGFVEDGGYARTALWTEEGRQWLAFSKARQPHFWIGPQEGGGYRLRTLVREIDMPWNWPVEVNGLEAKAFCNWLAERTGKPIRLPTEAEWYRLHDQQAIPDQPYWPKAPGNINLEHWASPCPVDRFPFGEFFDLIGNVWQWTETSITGFEGFEIHPYYDDFSTPTFDTRHNLIKGGSWISTGNEATRDARYAFRRHFFQHAGLRYVASEQPLPQPETMYETDGAVSQYCDAHYGPTHFDVPNFAVRCAAAGVRLTVGRPRRRALDLGCAVGRATFELARQFDEVTGIDYSARFIRVAQQLKENRTLHYELPEEGELVSYHATTAADHGIDPAIRERVAFFQGDATNLKPIFSGYDLILAANLIDRLATPAAFLDTVHERLVPGGILVLTSPYTWLEAFTKKDHWLGGVRRAGEPYWTLDALRDRLAAHFRMIEAPADIAFTIRETRRKYQHTVAQLTAWERIA